VENPTPDGPRFLTVGVKGDEFQLLLWPGVAGQFQPALGSPPPSVTFVTHDCRKTVEELKWRGVELSPMCSSYRGATSRSSWTRRQPATAERGPLAQGRTALAVPP
jgi:hypothetical protein